MLGLSVTEEHLVQPNPTHTYAASGKYTVTLTTTGQGNCSGTMSKTITVYDAPTASVSVADVAREQLRILHQVQQARQPMLGTLVMEIQVHLNLQNILTQLLERIQLS